MPAQPASSAASSARHAGRQGMGRQGNGGCIARCYLLKTMDRDLLAQSIRRAARGDPVLSPERMGPLVAAFRAQGAPDAQPGASLPPLSPREQEVLREIARGASNKAIARTLDIAETTVKIHVQHILRKVDRQRECTAAQIMRAFPWPSASFTQRQGCARPASRVLASRPPSAWRQPDRDRARERTRSTPGPCA
ncbi:hypothetical protein D5041_00060 [Verminephrobacter aporrectodeae subsp. tuberculatae]|nr:hypothetical protein [Verminephrobacter aporrectodeae subsp. tuberculatae]MCW5287512.1 hypothetical protein [Verminephrobacter aporrectodeae subsp. tuberculatae]